jgi:tetratricopeptide (TPR) repeat protein
VIAPGKRFVYCPGMRTCARLLGAALALVSGLALSGCFPNSQSTLDEQKEPHFLAGKNRFNARDYNGAIESYEKALQVNPHSASAHFEAGLLYENNRQDYAAAIYHFERFLELRPKSDYAEVVSQRILACKQELARTVSLGPVTQGMQRDFEQLNEENRRLREELEHWKAYAARLATNPPAAAQAEAVANPSASSPVTAVFNSSRTGRAVPVLMAAATPSTAARTHTIKPGDTPSAIARKYGVRVDALMAANPKTDARRLQIGQTLNVPGQ